MAKKQAPDVAEYLKSLGESTRFGPQVVHHEFLAGQGPRFQGLATPLPPELARLLAKEAPRLYSHQAQAMDAIRQGEDVIVATATASGKSLIYNSVVLESLLTRAGGHALYLFPLKALARDQLRRLVELAAGLPEEKSFTAAVCDGDTNSYQRRKLRDRPADIIISNPDMLHLSFLAYHERWARLWQDLRYVVIDEVHTYRGIFGSHMAWVLRRLQRICALYGSKPQFLLFSATVGNPAELARQLIGRPARAITMSGAPSAPRHFLLFDPWDGAAWAASQMLEAAVKRGLRTIVYSQSRKMTELVALWTQERLGPLQDKLVAYRAGFLPEERREIETRLAAGDLLGVVSTSALELGIDIGALDICILVGYPGSMMATWQRGGRVGRRQQESLVIMVAQEDALDQFFLRNPGDFFQRPVERAVLNPDNLEICKKHLLCAAAESPLEKSEVLALSPGGQEAVSQLVARGKLLLDREGKSYFGLRKLPQRQVELRGGGGSFVIRAMADGERIGEIDGGRCLKECHPGALYLHQGETWEVMELDLEDHEVRARPKKANYFTRVLSSKDTEILQASRLLRVAGIQASLGRLKVSDQVTGFQRKLIRGQKTISTESLDLPAHIFETEGLWFAVPAPLQDELAARQSHFMGGIHAVEHAVIGVMPLLVLCDRNDIGGISFPFHPQVGGPAIFIYDGHPGGVGLCAAAFPLIQELLRRSLEIITSCPCDTGCPSCVHSPKCGSGNRPIDKEAARLVITALLAGDQPLETMELEETERGEETAAREEVQELPQRWCVFDLETQRSAAEVGGWHHAHRMGISVGVVYDGEADEFIVFREGEVDRLLAFLASQELIVGFNNKRFDNRVLEGYGRHNLHLSPTIDLLEEVKKQLGYRLSLDRLATETLESEKSGDGLLALQWYKEGRIDKIINYCRHDVELTRDLFLFAREKRYLLFRNKGGQVVRCPLALKIPGADE
ncbi:MAG: DEAD/DEAH box helicase [Thermodesulfobacteriota bacterium]